MYYQRRKTSIKYNIYAGWCLSTSSHCAKSNVNIMSWFWVFWPRILSLCFCDFLYYSNDLSSSLYRFSIEFNLLMSLHSHTKYNSTMKLETVPHRHYALHNGCSTGEPVQHPSTSAEVSGEPIQYPTLAAGCSACPFSFSLPTTCHCLHAATCYSYQASGSNSTWAQVAPRTGASCEPLAAPARATRACCDLINRSVRHLAHPCLNQRLLYCVAQEHLVLPHLSQRSARCLDLLCPSRRVYTPSGPVHPRPANPCSALPARTHAAKPPSACHAPTKPWLKESFNYFPAGSPSVCLPALPWSWGCHHRRALWGSCFLPFQVHSTSSGQPSWVIR